MTINPIGLSGNWDDGYALDKHVISSTFLGEDENGRSRFDTIRTDIGELLNRFKYHNEYTCLQGIMSLAYPFLGNWLTVHATDVVIPVPASNSNRQYQPAYEIAREVANGLEKIVGRKIWYLDYVLQKTSSIQFKGLSQEEKHKIRGTVAKTGSANRRIDVLLVDDLYQTGSTLKECVFVLRQDPNIGKIYVLTITKTKR